MKQLVENLRSGETLLEDVPVPVPQPGTILVRTTRSLVSLGTERMLVEFGKANLINKARQQPEKVRQVLQKIQADGLMPTLEAVFRKLGTPLPLGYCNAGVVVEVGEGVHEFVRGDRVASNGNHAEYVCVPVNLAARIPDTVSDEAASFTVIGSIALQGIRLLNPTFGETVAVFGLGLIGQITAQLLKANGCRVIGIDLDESKVQLARQAGIEAVAAGGSTDIVGMVKASTNGAGADGVVITASGAGSDLVSQAAQMSRQRGRIILVGVVGLDLKRDDFYKKELSFQVSCSYGPGRYDEDYEQKGRDYPLGYVRWTEKRNFEAILGAIASGSLDVTALITERVPLASYQTIYADMRKTHAIASLLEYDEGEKDLTQERRVRTAPESPRKIDSVGIGLVGAGNFVSATVVPALKGLPARLCGIASGAGLSATTMARKAGFGYATSDAGQIFSDDDINLVMVITRHNLHAAMTLAALEAGKDVFVEKPLCMNREELQRIVEAKERSGRMVLVGFNRRFAPLSVRLRSLLGDSPKCMTLTMNAGFVPRDSWVQDPEVGGGRILGEACHLIDYATFLSGSPVRRVCMSSMGVHPDPLTDTASIMLEHANGDHATVHYFANGSKAYPKERMEVHSEGRTFVLDNFRQLTGHGVGGFSKASSRQDKGHQAQFRALVEGLMAGSPPVIPFSEVVNATQATFAALESLRTGAWVDVAAGAEGRAPEEGRAP